MHACGSHRLKKETRKRRARLPKNILKKLHGIVDSRIVPYIVFNPRRDLGHASGMFFSPVCLECSGSVSLKKHQCKLEAMRDWHSLPAVTGSDL